MLFVSLYLCAVMGEIVSFDLLLVKHIHKLDFPEDFCIVIFRLNSPWQVQIRVCVLAMFVNSAHCVGYR